MLERLGYKVTARTRSVDALEDFYNKSDSFDIVITDTAMPKMIGVDLSEEIMKINLDVPIILCTGFSEIIDKDKAKMLGIKAFVIKPLVVGEIAKTIRHVLDQREEK